MEIKHAHTTKPFCTLGFIPNYALQNLLRLEITAKYISSLFFEV